MTTLLVSTASMDKGLLSSKSCSNGNFILLPYKGNSFSNKKYFSLNFMLGIVFSFGVPDNQIVFRLNVHDNQIALTFVGL